MTSQSFLNTCQINGQEYDPENADHCRQAEAECFDHLWQKHSVGNLFLAMASFGIALIFRKMHFENKAKSLVEKTVTAKQQLDRLTPKFKQSLNLQGSLNKQWKTCTESINKSWRENVVPNLMKFSSDCSLSDLSAMANNYNFGAVVLKIKGYQAQGKKICLFIGRTPIEPLPSDLGEAEENEVWVSADIALLPSEGGRRVETSSDRLHLWLDFNQQEGLNLVKGLFQKVVVDISTVKALNSDFAKRFSILLQSSKSQITFELDVKCPANCFGEKEFFNPSNYSLTIPLALHDKQDQLGPVDSEEYAANLDRWEKELFTKYFKSHLNDLYHTVEQHNKVYPYLTNCTTDTETVDFFVVSNPKN